jgi:Flp pilus assembly pilin Flp
MTGTSASIDGQLSLRRLVRDHKRVSAAAFAGIVVLVAIVVLGVIGSGSWKVADTTSCTAWSSANQVQQDGYAALYVREHGALSGGATDAAGVIAAVNTGCTGAFGYDEADTVDVLQAIRGRY